MAWRKLELPCFAAFAALVTLCIFHRYGDIPYGLFSDDLAMGYDGECLDHTLHDQFGVFLPLNFRSLDDYKSPLAVYATAATVAVLGPTKVAVRLPCALFLMGGAVVLYFFLRRLTGREPLARWMAVLFLTVPSIFFDTHILPEGDSYVFTLILALCAAERFERLPAKTTAFVAGAAIGFCTYSYTTARLGAPLLLVAAATVFLFERSHRRFVPWLITGGALLAVPEALYIHLHPGALTKRFHTVSVFAKSDTMKQALGRIVEAYGVYIGSFDFLFRTGQHNDWHNAGLGFLPLWLFLPWIAGLVFLWKSRTRPLARLILAAWFLSPIPASLTYEVPPWFPHTTRALTAAPLALIIGAVAIGAILDRVVVPRAAWAVVALAVGGETVQAMNQYFNVYAPKYEAQGGFDGGNSNALAMAMAHRKPHQPLYLTASLYDSGLGIAYFADIPEKDFHGNHYERHQVFKQADQGVAPPGAIVVLKGETNPAFAFVELGRIESGPGQVPRYIVYQAM